MSRTFSDGERLKARAKKSLDDGMVQIKRWWAERYKLPPNHQLFTSRSLAEHMQDMYEDLIYRRDEIERNLNEGEGDSKTQMRQLSVINRVLGEAEEEQDDLFDQWERDLEAGLIPDLNAMPAGSD